MLTNGTARQENYYRIKFANLGYDVFEYGATALQAIARAIMDQDNPAELGGATARPAVYKEWNNATWRYRNDGGFIRGENWGSNDIRKNGEN